MTALIRGNDVRRFVHPRFASKRYRAPQCAGAATLTVYLDAMLPKDGDTAFTVVPSLLGPFTELSADLGGTMVAPWPSAVFGVGPQYQSWVDAKLTPHPLACFTQRLSLTGDYAKVRQKIMIWNETDIGLPNPFKNLYEAEALREGCHVYPLAGGHDFMIDNASGLAEILLRHHP